MKERPTTHAGWLYAEPPTKPDYDASRVGKWQLFIPRQAVDEVWADFASAVERGELGIGAKVSGAGGSGNPYDTSSQVIILYAADWRDIDDLRRMLRRIRAAGIAQHVYFKRDRETLAGVYKHRGNRNVSVWGSPDGDIIRTKWVGDGKAWIKLTAENEDSIVEAIQLRDGLA